uniref:nectin-2-like isoform X1 n=1 Tax=Scatophagus argus TaxID=75038 RepID=UPI001ED7EA9D|nr:nectin-2-like isoform X1 [Scatophagus argus]
MPCSSTMLLLMLVLNLSTAEALQVIGGNITVGQGGTAVLPCKVIDTTETVTQISWQRKTRTKTENENFFTVVSTNGAKVINGDKRFKFVGSVNDGNGTLQFSNVTLMDEGSYACVFTMFPSGNHKTEVPLNVLVPPVSSLQYNIPVLGNEEVSLVLCTAAGSRPPAEVKWLTGTLEGKVRATTNSTKHDNGTTTTVSSLFGVPTTEINHHVVQCVVTNAALLKEETRPFTLQVHFPPVEVNIRERAKHLFECVSDANPDADFTWSRPDNSWPQSAVRVGATLQFRSMTPELNGLYECEASNTFGRKRGHLYVHVTSEGCRVCWALFVILLILIAFAAGAGWYLYKAGKFQRFFSRSEEGTSREREPVRTSSRSRERTDHGEEEEEEDEEREEERPL